MRLPKTIHRLRENFRDLIASPRAPLYAVLLGALLALPSVFSGIQLDDHGLAVSVTLGKPPWDLFNFIRPEDVAQFREIGFLGWWSADDLRVGFLRPVTSLTHWIDFRCWPRAAWLMHLWNVITYALVVAAAGLIFRRMCSLPFAAGLAAVLFAIDDVHAQTVGWISARNALLATLFGFAALYAHDRWRRENWKTGAILAPLLFLLSLLSAEIGIACGGYILAHALCFERGNILRRLAPLTGYVLILTVWRVTYLMLGYGAVGTDLYRDVVGDPLGFVAASVRNAFATTTAQLTLPLSMPLALIPGAWLVAALLLAVIAWIIRPLLLRDPVARFFAVGTLAAAVPFGATIPSERLLLPLGLGASGLIACIVVAVKNGSLFGKAQQWTNRVLLTLNGVLALLMFVPCLFLMIFLEKEVLTLTDTIPATGSVVVVNSPMELFFLYPPSIRLRRNEPWPKHVYPLFAGMADIEIERTGDRVLEIRSKNGWLASPVDRITRSIDRPFRIGESISLEKMTVEILDTSPDGRPTAARFTFVNNLEEYAWVAWTEEGPQSWQPPEIGQKVPLEAAFFY